MKNKRVRERISEKKEKNIKNKDGNESVCFLSAGSFLSQNGRPGGVVRSGFDRNRSRANYLQHLVNTCGMCMLWISGNQQKNALQLLTDTKTSLLRRLDL